MLLTSSELDFDRRQTVSQAIAVLEQQGFSRQTFVLRHLVKYRVTDNWWNRSIGHHDAYAATNFPFEVVTLYPGFFDTAVDDTERAAILLHESYHLFGSGEAAALPVLHVAVRGRAVDGDAALEIGAAVAADMRR
jgi:hypothetical protein